jgi:hypothetical protein
VVGLFDRRGQVVHVPHQKVVLRDAAGDAGRVGLLKAVVADQVGGHLAGEHDDGDRVEVRVRDARHGVGGPGPARGEHGAHPPGGLGIALGGVGAALLVPDEDVVVRRLDALHRVVDLDDGPARMAEDAVHAFFLKGTDENFGAFQNGRVRRAV